MNESDLELYGIVGKMFREIREDKGDTLEYVSNYLGIAPKSLQRYECGERKIKIETISSFCSFYNIDCSKFMKEAKMRFVSDYELSCCNGFEIKSHIKFDKNVQDIIDKANKLNSEGIAKLNEYADDLVSSGKYEKTRTNDRVG